MKVTLVYKGTLAYRGLTSCITSMAETNLDAIRKQKNAEYSKRYRLKMQQQAPTTSEAEPEKLQV